MLLHFVREPQYELDIQELEPFLDRCIMLDEYIESVYSSSSHWKIGHGMLLVHWSGRFLVVWHFEDWGSIYLRAIAELTPEQGLRLRDLAV
jgi:hypothetical protein